MRKLVCPSCGATLSFAEEREFGFCEYCGEKVILDDYRSTQRIVDEAKIKEAEVKREIRLKELELEESKFNQQQKKDSITKIILAVGGFAVLFIICIVIMSGNNSSKEAAPVVSPTGNVIPSEVVIPTDDISSAVTADPADEAVSSDNAVPSEDDVDISEPNDTNESDLDPSLQQVMNPSESFVIERISTIPGVLEIEAVTEDNDPNGHLHKAGGYTATVYFTYDKVEEDLSHKGESVVDKGTEGGGAVEVYANVKDAEKRNTYLSAYDGGILSSGSHTVCGTCVVRTSDYLTASQQKDLETKIINALTDVK